MTNFRPSSRLMLQQQQKQQLITLTFNKMVDRRNFWFSASFYERNASRPLNTIGNNNTDNGGEGGGCASSTTNNNNNSIIINTITVIRERSCQTIQQRKTSSEQTASSLSCSSSQRSICVRCGIQTYTVGLFGRTSVTNSEVYHGICIRCNPQSVPQHILQEWEKRHTTHCPEESVSSVVNRVSRLVGNARKSFLDRQLIYSTRLLRPSSTSREEKPLSPPKQPLQKGPTMNTTTVNTTSTRRAPVYEDVLPCKSSTTTTTTTTTTERSTCSTTTERSIIDTAYDQRQHQHQHPDICPRCGIQVKSFHVLWWKSITNENVYCGICIRCNQSNVPPAILAEWKAHNGPVAPCAMSMMPSIYGDTGAVAAAASVHGRHE